MQTINCVIRLAKFNDDLELFYYDERKDLTCFSMTYGHSMACLEYMYNDTLPLKTENQSAQAQALLDSYNAIDNDGSVVFVLKKRLNRY